MPFEYRCSKCGEYMSVSHQSARVERFVGTSSESSRWHDRLDPDKEKPKTITISVTGLGTWRCPTHGKVPCVRTKK